MNWGGVYLADLNPGRGSEQAGIRPVIVVQRDNLARFTRTTIVVPLTSNLRRARVPGTVTIPAGKGGLRQDSVALCYQVAVVDRQRLLQQLGRLTPFYLRSLKYALQYTLDLNAVDDDVEAE